MRLIKEMTLFTRDLAGVTDFYRSLLDAEPVHRDASIALFIVGQIRLLIHVVREQGEDGLPFEDHVALSVDNLDQTAGVLLEQGLQFDREPKSYSWGRSAYLRDPDGRLLELHED